MAAVRQGWRVLEQVRGEKELAQTSQEYLGRLRKGKEAAAVPQGQAVIDVAARRFEAPADFTSQPEPTPSPRPTTPPSTPAKPAATSEADDFAARLMKAKQKAREQMEGQKEE
jgi:hypothetical protein